LATATPKP